MTNHKSQTFASRKLKKRIMFFLFGFSLILPPTVLAQQQTIQTQKIQVKTSQTSLRELFKIIEGQSNFLFFYVDSDIEGITVQPQSNGTIREILDAALKNSALTYTVNERHINISKKKAENSEKSTVSRKITGTIFDSNGATIIGATVLVKNTTTGAMTDAAGRFSLEVAPDAVLAVSYLGFQTQEVVVRGASDFQVVLEESDRMLEEIVVTGYGSVSKKDMTGAISVFTMKNANEQSGVSPVMALQGKIAGLQVTQGSGAPGTAPTILLRGANSVSGNNSPLIVIDGVPMDNEYASPGSSPSAQSQYIDTPAADMLSTINPNDIESIQVMKDASSTALYGSRGANGVILITTKQGKAGRTKVNFSTRYDVGMKPEIIPMLSTQDYFNYLDEAYYNTYNTLFTSIAANARGGYPNTNWQREIYRLSGTQDYQLSMTGGKNDDRFSLMAGYTDMSGSIRKTDFRKANIRFNNTKQLSQKFSLNLNAAVSLTEHSRMPQGSSAVVTSSTVLSALVARPYVSPFTDDGEVDASSVGVGNPIATIEGTYDVTKVKNMNLNTKLTYKPLTWLTVDCLLSGNYNAQTRDVYWNLMTAFAQSAGNRRLFSPNESQSYRSVITANFIKTIQKKHRVNAVMGYEWAWWNNRYATANSSDFPIDAMLGADMSMATSQIQTRTSETERAMTSVITRANYTFDNKYMVMFTGRLDGSSLLAPDNRYSFFPSLGVAWYVSEEGFMKPAHRVMNSFKLRASYGFTGNQAVSNGAYLQKMSSSKISMGTGAWLNALGYSSFYNPDLKWETTRQANFGFDANFLSNKISLSFDYYHKKTDDLLFEKNIPVSNGYSTYFDNDGTVLNKGIEVELTSRIANRKNFKWELSSNFTHNRNEIISLGVTQLTGKSYSIGSMSSVNVSVAKPGYPIGAFYGYRFDGIYQNQKEVAAGPTINGATASPGDMRYVNYADNEVVNDITATDQFILGNPYPDFTFGMTNSFSYKNISLSFLVDVSIGQDVVNMNRFYTDGLVVISSMANGANTYNVSQRAYDNRWRGEGSSNYYPRPQVGAVNLHGIFSDFLVEDASFVKLRNLTLGYTLNFKKAFISDMRVFVSGQNLLTFSNYSGYDPEVNVAGQSAINQGVDMGTIPNMRVFSVGTNLNF